MTHDLVPRRAANGVERAALVLLALGDTHGASVWSHFSDEEAVQLAAAIGRLGPVETIHAEAALRVFADALKKSPGISGTAEKAEALLAKVLPEERVAPVLDRLRRPGGPGLWEELATLDDRTIAGYLDNEHPQTTAIVLMKMNARRAATILCALDRNTAIAALSRMARMRETDTEALAALESALSENLVLPNQASKQPEPALRIAPIFDAVDQRTGAALLQAWSASDADAATEVRGLMFTFDDFLGTPAAALQTLLRGLDRDVLALALKTASDELRARFYEQMSARAARMLENQIATSGPVRRKDVAEAQLKVVAMARDLERAGEIELRVKSAAEDAEDMIA